MQQIPHMSASETLAALWQFAGEHMKLPAGFEWAPLTASCGCALFGLLLLVRGARWAPGLAGLLFGGICGAGAAAIAQNNGYATSALPAGLVAGVVGLGLCLLMFRVLQAAIMAGVLALVGVSVYYARGLHTEVANWVARGVEGETLTLRPAGEVVGANGWHTAGELWNHLVSNVPQFQLTLGSIVGLTLAAGFVFGFLLPRLSRAIWASTLGVVICGVGATGLMQKLAPDALAWLSSNTETAWSIVGAAWLISLGINLISTRKTKKASITVEPAPAAKPVGV